MLTVATCVYRSEPFLEAFTRRSQEALASIGCAEYELLYVVDGSPDASLALLLRLQQEDPHIRVVEFSRNFGHHAAAHAALAESRGDQVFLIDCDMEVDPLVLVDFWRSMQEEPCDVVYGYQETRKGGLLERSGGGMFWTLFNLLSETKVPPSVLTERLMTREYVNALLELGDRNLFLGGMFYWVGFNQRGIPVAKKQRQGASTYNLARRLNLAVDAVTSFSGRPLKLLFRLGLLVTALSLSAAAVLVAVRLSGRQFEMGWTSIITMQFLTMGVTMMSLGVVGIYLHKVFIQVQSRPLYVIRRRHGAGRPADRATPLSPAETTEAVPARRPAPGRS